MQCYFITVCQGSALDRYTNNFSLFSLLEEFAPSQFPAQLGVNVIAFFMVGESERNVEHEVRLVLSRDGDEVSTSDALAFTPTAARHRVRMTGLVIPEAGEYRVQVDWRQKEELAWHREDAVWPLWANGPLQ
jgi:hypothetical protein